MFKNRKLQILTGLLCGAVSLTVLSASSLEDWTTVGDANWQVETGLLTADQGSGFVLTKRPYRDFSLTLDFYSGANTNSGVFFRCSDNKEINDKTCYEANIFDHRPDQSGRTGSIVNVAAPRVVIETEEQWNTYEIKAVGSRLQVKLNGVLTVDTEDLKHSEGPIALQFASGQIKFRNIEIEALSPSAEVERDLVGVWRLTQFEMNDGSGVYSPWCEGSHGTIMYYADYMSVAINCTSQPEKMVLYSGPYHIDADGYVYHDVQNSNAASMRQVYKRKVELSGRNELKLIGPFGDGGEVVVAWERID